MFIRQNIGDFIDNPMGRGSNAIPSRQLIKEDLNNRLQKILDNKDKEITFKVYKGKDDYYLHFLIPSESKRKNTYDVVLRFFLDDETKQFKDDSTVRKYHVQFFSNSPGFVYTFGHAFALHGLFIESLSDKYDEEVFNRMPVTRNPGEIVSYEKTTYFAMRYLLNNIKYLGKSYLDSVAKKFDEAEFKKSIRNTDRIQVEIKEEQRRVEREEKEEKEKSSKKNSPKPPRREENKFTGSRSNGSKQKITGKPKIVGKKSSKPKIRPR